MFDAAIRPVIDPVLKPLASAMARAGISANLITLAALVPAAAACYFISAEAYAAALAMIVLNRLLDGLDGMVARMNGPSALGGYLDILADFAFYVAVPVGFGLAAPENLQPAMLLVAAFTLTGISFLAYAATAANAQITDGAHGPKAFLYSTGLMEGGETILFFAVFCLAPGYFAALAYIFSALCIVTVLQRSWLAATTLQ